MKTLNITLAGVGGQGIILAADMLALAAAKAGLDVKKSEIHGMAQRGGSVVSQVRIGDSVASPIVQHGKTDILVCFDKLEALRMAQTMAPDGIAIVNDMYLTPVTVSSGQQADVPDLDARVRATPGAILVDAMGIAEKGAGSGRTMNMVLAGALSAHCPIDERCWREAAGELFSGPKAGFLEMNLKAFALGREAAAGGAET